MANHYGPWATPINTGSNPQLSAFWKRRLRMLVHVSRTKSALSKRNLTWIIVAGLLLIVLPTFHSVPAAADDKKTAEEEDKGSGISRPVTIEEVEGTDVIVIKGRKKDIESAAKLIFDKKPAEAEKVEKKTNRKEWKLANGMTMSSGSSRDFPVKEEIKQLIATKDYKFINTFEDSHGDKQYVYSFTLSDGNQTGMNFSMSLDNVSSWEDYVQQQEKQQKKRHEKINEAIVSGNYRLLNVEIMQNQICRDVESNEKIKFQRIAVGKEKEIAFPRADYGKIPSTVKETSWQEHLQAIQDGKRELLASEIVNNFIYEMTADDGTKVIFHYGGNKPLKKIPAKK